MSEPLVIEAPVYPGRTLYWQYKATASVVLGVFQIVAGLVIAGAAAVLLTTDHLMSRLVVEPGFAAAILLIATGILAILAGKRKNQCLIVGTLVMTLSSAGSCSSVLSPTGNAISYIISRNFQDASDLTIALMGTVFCVALITMIISLVLSCFGCGALCCRCCINQRPTSGSQAPSYYSDPSTKNHEIRQLQQHQGKI